MAIVLDDNSEVRLVGVHRDLVAVVRRAAGLSDLDFIVTEGIRSLDRQAALLKAGATQTMHSRHLTGHAVDLAARVEGEVRWDWPLYDYLGRIMKLAAHELDVAIIWGGDWQRFRDGPHFELDRARYMA